MYEWVYMVREIEHKVYLTWRDKREKQLVTKICRALQTKNFKKEAKYLFFFF